MTVIKDSTKYVVSKIELLPALMVISGFMLLIVGLFVPYSDYSGEVGLKIVIGGGIIMITGALLAIEQKIPTSIITKE